MSLITESSASPESRTVDRYWRCCWVSWLFRTSSVMPMTAFSGVRISWLMLARNVLLARLAASAASLAARRASASRILHGDVLRNAECAHNMARVVQQWQLGRGAPGRIAVGPGFLLHLGDDALPGAEDFLFVGQGFQRVLVGEEIEVRLVDGVVGVGQVDITGHGLVNADEAALRVFEVDVVRQVVHQRVEQVALLL